MERSILFDTPFELNGKGGGQRRACQLVHLITRAGFEPVPVRRPPAKSLHRLHVAAQLPRVARHYRRLSLGWQQTRACARAAHDYHAAMRAHGGARLFLCERSRGYGFLAAEIARSLGFVTMALPQNLECFVPDQADPVLRRLPFDLALADEVARLSQYDAVVAISREEQWLLSNRGIDAGYLPYFPPPRWEQEFLELRKHRRPGKGDLLVLGSATNPAVRKGIESILLRLGPMAQRQGVTVHVVGNDTELLRPIVEESGATLHGRIAESELHELLRIARAGIVFQQQGGGALTKVSEFLLAGVPVIANEFAARSAHNYDGVHLFSSDDELEDLISRSLPTPPPPARPHAEEERFLRALQQYETRGRCA